MIPAVERCCRLLALLLDYVPGSLGGLNESVKTCLLPSNATFIDPANKEFISNFNRFGEAIDALTGDCMIASAEAWKKLKASWQKAAVICSVAETDYTANNFSGFKVDVN